MELYHNDIT